MTTKQKRDRDNASRIPRRLRQALPIEQCAGCEHNETIRCKRFEKPAMEWARPGGCRCYVKRVDNPDAAEAQPALALGVGG